jgi:hypothetical protein
MIKSFRRYGLCVTVIAFTLVGCAAVQPLPNVARAGDTVALAMVQADGTKILNPSDVPISITDSAGNVYPLKLRDFFRVYSDPTSEYAQRGGTSVYWPTPIPLGTYATPHLGQWIGVVDLTDPTTGSPLALQPGAAKITYTIGSGSSAYTYTSNINIIAGSGAPNPLYGSNTDPSYHPLDTLEPMPQVMVATSGSPSAPIGGAEFTFSYVTADFGTLATQPRAVSPIPGDDVVYSRQDAGNGRTDLTVLVTNPHGFNGATPDPATGLDSLQELTFAVVWDKSLTSITDSNWKQYLQLVSSKYVGLDGTPITGLTTTVTKTR